MAFVKKPKCQIEFTMKKVTEYAEFVEILLWANLEHGTLVYFQSTQFSMESRQNVSWWQFALCSRPVRLMVCSSPAQSTKL